MATFKENLSREFGESLRDRFESNTGIFGQALRSKRENEEKAKNARAQAERINTTTSRLRSTSAALSSMETRFVQISKNMRLIAEAMGAEVTLQEEISADQKKLNEIAKKRLALRQEINLKKQKDLSKLNKRVDESITQQKDNKSLFENILDLLDDLPGGKRGGRGRGPQRGPQQPRTPPAGQQPRVPTGGTPPRTPPRIPTLPPGAAAGAGRIAGAVLGPAAAAATVAYGTYEAAKFARQSELGRRLAEGEGGRAQATFRQKDTQYGADISPESARAILDQPDSPGRRRDIEAFGGLQKLERLAAQARIPTATRTRQEIVGSAPGRQRVTPQPVAQTGRATIGAQEHVFTGPMGPVATQPAPAQAAAPRPTVATQQRPAPAQPATQQPAPAGSTVNKLPDKKTDDQGAKNPGPGAPQRKEGAITRPKNVIIGERADLSPGKVNEGLLQRVYLAAEKYGKRVTITSAFRPDSYQALLYVRGLGGQKDSRKRPADWPAPDPGIYIPSLPKTAQTVTWKGRTFDVPGSGRHNVHLEMSELDLSPGVADPKWVEILREFGVVFPYGAMDPPHASIMRKNRDGADAPPLASLLSGTSSTGEAPPSNVLMTESGVPVTTGTGGFVTSGTPAPAPATAAPDTQREYEQGPGAGVISSPKEFVKKLFPGAVKAAQSMGVSVLALMGQWAGEASWGKKPTGDYNYFGLKSFGKPPHRLVATTERLTDPKTVQKYKDRGWYIKDLGGNNHAVYDLFKSFSSPDQAIQGQEQFLRENKRYQAAGLFNSMTVENFATAMKKAGYATSANYKDFLVSMASSIRRALPKEFQPLFNETGDTVATTSEINKISTALATGNVNNTPQSQPTTIVVQNNNNTTVKKPGTQVARKEGMALVGA